ncbi:MAG: hydroxyacylglutathione hydrolase, partial [Alphaproteobacteria bacterium]|nr:hydroxyacylglutathione hydrolase [Alphaproteobacteria bacterium]
TLGIEKEVNTFFRLKNTEVIENLRKTFPDLSENPGMKEVFLKLRELRNDW